MRSTSLFWFQSRATRVGLVGALTEHYGSPGRLADYLRQFERMNRPAGEDPSIFPIALETLAVKAFGDMGQTARLRIISDRFIAGHDNCELCRHLDSVSPETPIRDIVDRCRVWESHTDSDTWRFSHEYPTVDVPAKSPSMWVPDGAAVSASVRLEASVSRSLGPTGGR